METFWNLNLLILSPYRFIVINFCVHLFPFKGCPLFFAKASLPTGSLFCLQCQDTFEVLSSFFIHRLPCSLWGSLLLFMGQIKIFEKRQEFFAF